MKILVIGSGGREHAIAWKLAQSEKVTEVFVAPGNAGTALEPKVSNIDCNSHADLIDFCQQNKIDLTIVGPEAPLAAGIVDDFRAKNLKIFGPTKAAAQLESSKDFAKQFMQKYQIPTAQYQTFTEVELAKAYVASKSMPIVIKADGLAAGKGVVVANTMVEANQSIEAFLVDNKFGDAGAKVVIEDFLEGVEASFIVMVDGEHILPLATSQDHKRLLDHDLGPNTGGMGAHSPAQMEIEATFLKAMQTIIEPTVKGMQAEGHPFTGFLYAGLMIDKAGNPFTVEFNCRMGDPETQPIMLRLKTDLVDLMQAACEQSLDKAIVGWDSKKAVGVVMAAANYPESPRKGDVISGIDSANQFAKVFHAGTKVEQGNIVTNGGRVLCVVGLGDDLKEARKTAYQGVAQINFAGMQYRTDISQKAVVEA